ncbi:hypothetical protein A2U01_0083971, partial [Trifolium medium]|nr:hypothetical protein [Trifolium medium]
MELTTEDEPTVKGKPKSTPIQPNVYTTEEPQATVAPYPPKYEKKEAIKEQNKKFEGY